MSAVQAIHLLPYAPLLFPALVMPAARPLSERLEPRLATWLLTASAVVLAVASSAALGVLALAGLARLPVVAWAGRWSVATVRAGESVSVAEALVSGILLAVAACCALRALWRRVRAVAAAFFEAACMPGRDQLVIVHGTAPEAYALPGLPGRVVVSTGMLDALDEPDRDVLLAHEQAHLAAHHYVFVAAAHLAAAANPLLRPFSTAVGYAVERWADERAAQVCGDRGQVARAVGKAALAARRARVRRVHPAALGLLGRRRGPLHGAGPVPRRVAALLAPAPELFPPLGRSTLTLAITGMLVAASLLCSAAAAHDLHELLKSAAGSK